MEGSFGKRSVGAMRNKAVANFELKLEFTISLLNDIISLLLIIDTQKSMLTLNYIYFN